MPSTIGKCKLFRIKYITLLEGETFLRNKQKIAFFFNKNAHFLVGKKIPLVIGLRIKLTKLEYIFRMSHNLLSSFWFII